ncbi:MAG: hypothetical protein LAP38_11695 [Acidobacteriia bacterium]|nr:hypothetical protein [Terriglobia bacterium]
MNYLSMTSMRVGKSLIVTGIVLFALWTDYFLHLVRPMDIWDFCPLPLALTVVLIGFKLARFGLGELILAHAAVSYKRDLVLSLAIGGLAELSLLAFFNFVAGNDPEMAGRYIQLQRLQDPGATVGLAVFKYLYSHLGVSLSRDVGTFCAVAVLIAFWSLGVFAILTIFRFLRHAKSR